jgi:hypothetical protein
VKPASTIIDRQRKKDTRDACHQKLAHGEHVAAIKEWRQYLEHAVVVRFGNLEPFADVARAIHPVIVERRLIVAIKQGVHLVA